MMRAWPCGTPLQRAGISPAHAACFEEEANVCLKHAQAGTAVVTAATMTLRQSEHARTPSDRAATKKLKHMEQPWPNRHILHRAEVRRQATSTKCYQCKQLSK